MFSMLTTCYLFLGGVGAGALVVLSALECINVRRRFGGDRSRVVLSGSGLPAGMLSKKARASLSTTNTWQVEEVWNPGFFDRVRGAFAVPDEVFVRSWPLCAVCIAVGILCLLSDLGRPDRLMNLIFSPEWSAVTVGAYALALSLFCAVVFSAVSLLDTSRIASPLMVVLSLVGITSGVVAVTYTGVLLQGLSSVLFWQTPLLPLVFTLSSLSCGIALVFLGASFVETRHPFVRPLVWLARVDGILIILEFVCLVAYLTWAFFVPGAQEAARAFVLGDMRWLFWGGLVVGGLVVPLVLERFVSHGNYRTQLLWIAVFLLVGGFVLRFCVVGASAYDITQTPATVYGVLALR